MTRLLAFLIPLLATTSTALGCGMMPPGQARTMSFTITGFTLPAAMVSSGDATAPAQIPGIGTSVQGAQAFVSRLVMQAVIDVLERQGRGAGLSDDIISIILGQLTVRVNYTPMQCMKVTLNPAANAQFMGVAAMMMPHCIIIGNTVTALCSAENAQMCQLDNAMMIGNIPDTHLSISGSLTTTNVIMANWSREMWESVVNRAVRMLASGPFGANFASAFATVN